MAHNDQEIEVKFYLTDLQAVEAKLRQLGARLVQPRILETNLRFDTPSRELTRTGRVLRLRQDQTIRLTYKGSGRSDQGVQARQEIEFTVGSFESARALFEALGYTISMIYEKYRTTYEINGVQIVLDEMPYGNFAEIEGPDAAAIQAANQSLVLNWDRRILDSYSAMFEKLRGVLGFTFRDLTFANFKDLPVSPIDLNVQPADSKD